jgi:hypothetical protein
MFCPVCKSEYRKGVTQCSDCGVSLVDKLEDTDFSGAGPGDEEELVPIWSGDDPRECAGVKEALDKADIAYTDQSAAGYFIFPSLRPKMEIRVSASNAERAAEIVRDLLGEPDAEPNEGASAELRAGPDGNAAYRERILSGDGATTDDFEPEYPSADWDEEEAISEVWNGDSADFGSMLLACFRENGIASRTLAQNGKTRLLVRPEDEPRAREIVREVIEGTPMA